MNEFWGKLIIAGLVGIRYAIYAVIIVMVIGIMRRR